MAKEIKGHVLISRMKMIENILQKDAYLEASYEPEIVYSRLKNILLRGKDETRKKKIFKNNGNIGFNLVGVR